MRVALGKFAQSGIESQIGADISAAVKDGLAHYTRLLNSERPPVEVPRFCLDQAGCEAEPPLEVAVDPQVETALRAEAQRQKVPLSQILTHAVLVYLAAVDTVSVGQDTLV